MIRLLRAPGIGLGSVLARALALLALARLREIAAAKYPTRPPGGGEIWVFAVASRGGAAR